MSTNPGEYSPSCHQSPASTGLEEADPATAKDRNIELPNLDARMGTRKSSSKKTPLGLATVSQQEKAYF